MDARLLDVLHDAADHNIGAVAQGVDIRLEGILQKAIDQDGVLGRGRYRPAEVASQRSLVIDDLHGPPRPST